MIVVAEPLMAHVIYHDHETLGSRPAADVYLNCALPGLGRRGSLGVLGDHADGAAPAPRAELDLPSDQGEQGVIPAAAHAEPRVEMGSVLPDDDLARAHELAAEPLDPESLGVGVAPVPAG
jgi:hypothetical protein